MNDSKAKLLLAASEVAGGLAPLGRRLGVSEAMLRKYISGVFPLPDPLLLQALDYIQEGEESPPAGASRAAGAGGTDSEAA